VWKETNDNKEGGASEKAPLYLLYLGVVHSPDRSLEDANEGCAAENGLASREAEHHNLGTSTRTPTPRNETYKRPCEASNIYKILFRTSTHTFVPPLF
jgi:hypothetical protein